MSEDLNGIFINFFIGSGMDFERPPSNDLLDLMKSFVRIRRYRGNISFTFSQDQISDDYKNYLNDF